MAANPTEQSLDNEDQTDPGRQRSTIGFPYAALDDAEDLATAIHSNVGRGSCSDDQLAPWLNLSAKSSGFRVRVSAAKMFSLISSPDSGHFALTELGRQIVDPNEARAARAEAFLKVPLFNKVYIDHKGHSLPPAPALERYLTEIGVAPKQAARARQVLERSAGHGGYFEQGNNRLVKPGIKLTSTQAKDAENNSAPDQGSEGHEPALRDFDPLILGLVQKLPKLGESWDREDRRRWEAAAKSIFDLVYGYVEPKQNKPLPKTVARMSQDLDDEIPF